MNGLVLEGGTFRPLFSCGVMDALLSEDIMMPYCIGVSAGISDGVSYISRQKGRNLEIVQKYRNDKRYIGRSNYRKHRSLFGLDFVFGEIPNSLVPFDMDTFKQYEGTCLVGVTNAATGEAQYMDAMDMDDFTAEEEDMEEDEAEFDMADDEKQAFLDNLINEDNEEEELYDMDPDAYAAEDETADSDNELFADFETDYDPELDEEEE